MTLGFSILLCLGMLQGPNAVVARLKASLVERFGPPPTTVEVRLPAGATLPEDVRWRWTSSTWPAGWTHVQLLKEGRPAGYLRVYVAWYDSVVVLRQTVSRHQALDPTMVQFVHREVTSLREGYLTPRAWRALPPSLRARRPLRAGAVLRPTDVEAPPAVRAGDPVVLHASRGAMAIKLPCEARQDGQPGARIRIFCSVTGKQYEARVVGPGQTEWIKTLSR